VTTSPSPLTADTGPSLPGFPLVVSIVVNYNGIDDTRRCVASLLASGYARQRIVIVDNASPAGDGVAIAAELGHQAHVIASAVNLGYGGAANLGIRWALEQGASYAWVLNNDTVVDSHCVQRLVDAMESAPEYGMLSPQISAPVGPEAPHGIWFTGGSVFLARADVRHSTDELSGVEVVPTQYVTGCAMFLRSTSLKDSGLFQQELFLYWEDVDLSLRMLRAGWEIGVAPSARIFHAIHGSVVSRTVEYYHFRNAVIILRRFGSRRVFFSGVIFAAGGVARRWARAGLRRRTSPIAATKGFLTGLVIGLTVTWVRIGPE
jgi:GT2 family glycosyltransferase